MDMTVSKIVRIDAAHFLPNYDGACSQVHGHSWELEVGITGPVEKSGMVVDFKVLSAFLESVKAQWDHTLLNTTVPNPTAENLVLQVVRMGNSYFLTVPKCQLEFVRIWETPTSCAEWRSK